MKDEKILQTAKRIRKKFKTQYVDDPDQDEMDFLDELDEHIKSILGDDHKDIYTTLDKEKLEKWAKRRSTIKGRIFPKVFSRSTLLFCLLSIVTLFLMSEALDFYSMNGVITSKTYLKAALTEISFIFLSVYRTSGKLQLMAVGALRVALFSLMLFVISSGVIFSGTNTRSEISNLSQQITLIEQQIEAKEKEIQYYMSIKWPINVTKSRAAKEKLVDKLISIKEKQIAEKKNEDVSDLVLYQTYGRALFRVILLLMSVLISRKLFKV